MYGVVKASFGANQPTAILSFENVSAPPTYVQIKVIMTVVGKTIPSRGPYPGLDDNL